MSFLLSELEKAQARGADCLFCGIESYQSERYLEGIINDGVNDPLLRQQLSRQGGYCQHHLGRFVDLAHILASAIILHDFLAMRFARVAQGKPQGKIHCSACEVERKVRHSTLASLKKQRRDEAVQHLLKDAPFCVTHMELVAQAVPALREALADRHRALMQDLSELIRKHDYRFTHETVTDDEKKSIRAGGKLFGVTVPKKNERNTKG